MSEDWPYGRISQGTIRDECVSYLAKEFPQVAVISRDADALRLQLTNGAYHQVFLDRIYSAIADLDGPNSNRRHEIYKNFFQVLNDRIPDEISWEMDAVRIRPRVVSLETLQAMQRQIGMELPKSPLHQTGLWVLYVLDSEHSVAFVTEPMRNKLGISKGQLHQRALDNLATTFDVRKFIAELEAGSMVRVMTLDSYDASRLLLLPEHVPEGVRLAVAVPDRDLMFVLRAEDDSAFEVMSQIAKLPSERPIHDGALEVTNGLIRLY
jgi:hypothetical protein